MFLYFPKGFATFSEFLVFCRNGQLMATYTCCVTCFPVGPHGSLKPIP